VSQKSSKYTKTSDQIQYIMAGNCFLGDELCDAPSVWPAVGHCEPICRLTSILALMSLVWEEADVTHRTTISRRG
jgi:hypothetical protein